MMILLVIGTFLFGVFIGGFLWNKIIMRAYARDPKAVIELFDKDTSSNTVESDEGYEYVELEVEKHGNQIMMWFKECGTFVSQGETVDEALEVAHERFPKFNFHFELPDDIEYTVA